MAAKRTKRTADFPAETPVYTPSVTPQWQSPMTNSTPKSKGWVKWAVIVAGLMGLVLVWWWKTSSWPVVATVNGKLVTRNEIEQALFKQYGQSAIEGLITERQIEAELDRQNIQVDQKEVDAKIDEIKAQLGPNANFEQELASRGMDAARLRNLIMLQLRLNKAVEGSASVSAEEVDAYVKANAQYLSGTTDAEKKIEAENALKQDKMSAEIEKWVETAKSKSQVWRLYPLPTTAPAPTEVPSSPAVSPSPTK